MMCWSGSRRPRRLTNSRSASVSAGVKHALEVQIQFHARHFEQMREQKFGLQPRRLDAFFAKEIRAFLNRFEDGHAINLNSIARKQSQFCHDGFLSWV